MMDDNSYEDGTIVWVKLGTCWWPGEVCVESRLPEELIASIKKRPIAVVRFFGETTYECVKNVNNICEYNGPRKDEFIKKGLTLFRNNQKYMEKFPIDVSHAERLTDGDIDIISSEKFLPLKKTTSNSNIFGESSTPRSKKGRSAGRKSSNRQPVKSKALIAKTPVNINFRPVVNQNIYKCHLCAYSANRCNVLILHMKTHTINNSPPSKGNDITTNQTPSLYTSHDAGNHQETFDEIEKSLRLKLQLQPSQDDSISDDSFIAAPLKKRKPKKPGLKHDILADWSEDDDDDEDGPTDDAKSETTAPEATVVETEISTRESIGSKGSETIQSPVEYQGGFLVPDKTVTAPKYRNIPKKDRRDIILKEFNNGEVFNPCEQTEKQDHINVAISQLDAEITDPENSVEEAVEKSIEMEISPVSVDEIPCNTIEENIANLDESVMGISIDVTETIADLSQPTSQEMLGLVENDEELKTSTLEKSKEPEKVKTISYFDFKEDDEEEDFLSSISKLKMKYMSPDKNKELDMEKKETFSLDQKKIETEQRDEQLTTDIENLLNTTKLSNIQIHSVVTTPELSREVRALPPKERGKRIFKSRNRSVTTEMVLDETKIATPRIVEENSSQPITVDVNSSLAKIDSLIGDNDVAAISNNEIAFENAVANIENCAEEQSLPIETAIIIQNDEGSKERSYTIEDHPKEWNNATELLSVENFDNNLRADEEPVTENLNETVETVQSERCEVEDVTETEILDVCSQSINIHEEPCIDGEIVKDQITEIVDNGRQGLTEELNITDGRDEAQIEQSEEPNNVEEQIADIVGHCYEISEDGQSHTETVHTNDTEIVMEIGPRQEEEQEIVEIDTDNLNDSFEREAHDLQIIEADHTNMIIYNDELDMDAIEAVIVENAEECYVECEEEIVLQINTQNVNEEQESYIHDTVIPVETENESIILNDSLSQLNESEMTEEHTTVQPEATECDSGEDNESVDSTAVELSDGNADQVMTENEAELSVLAVAETLISIPSKLCEENRTAWARSIEFERERSLDDVNIYVMQQQEEEEIFKIDTQPATNDYSVDDEKLSEKAINRTVEKLKTKELTKRKLESPANIEYAGNENLVEENPNNERVLAEESDDSIPLDKLFATKKTKGMRSRKGSNHSYDAILEDRVIKKQVAAQIVIDEEDSVPPDTIHLRKSTRQQTRRSLDNFWALENQTADLVFPQRIGLRRSTRQKSRISFDNTLENEKSYEESIMKFYGNLPHDNNVEEPQNETAEADSETSMRFEADNFSTDDSPPTEISPIPTEIEISPVQVEGLEKYDTSLKSVEVEKVSEEHKQQQDTDVQFFIASTEAIDFHVSKQNKSKKEKLRKTRNHSNENTVENLEHDLVGNESEHNSIIEIQQKDKVIEIEKPELQQDLVASIEDITPNASEQGLLKKIKLRKSLSNSTQGPKYDIVEKEQNNDIEVLQEDDVDMNADSEDPKKEKSKRIQTKQTVEKHKYIVDRDSIEERKNTQRNINTALKPKRRNSRKVTDDVIDVQKNIEELGCQLNIVEDKADSNLDEVEKKFVDDMKTKEVRLKKVYESDKIVEEHKPQQEFGANEPEQSHNTEEPDRIIEKNKKHQPQQDVVEIEVENVRDVFEVPQGNKKSMRKKSRHSSSPVHEQQVAIEKELDQTKNEIDVQRKDKSFIKKSNSKRSKSKDFYDSVEVQKNVEEAIPQQDVIEEKPKQPEQKSDSIETQQKDEGDVEHDKSKRKRSKKGLRNSHEKNIDEHTSQKDVIEKVTEKAEIEIAQQIKECNVDSTKLHHSIEVEKHKPKQDVFEKVQEETKNEPNDKEVHQKVEDVAEDGTSKRNRSLLSKKCDQSEQTVMEKEAEQTDYKLSDFVALQKEEVTVEHKKSKRKRSRKGLRHSVEKVDESKQVFIEKEPEQIGNKLDDFEVRQKDKDTIDPVHSKRKRLRTGSHHSAEVEKNDEQSQHDITVSEQKEDKSQYNRVQTMKDQVKSESVDHKKSKRKGSKKSSSHSIETQLAKPEDDKYLEVELRSDKLIIRKTKRKSDSSIEAGKENDDDCKDDETSDDKLPQFEIVYCQQQTDESPSDDKSLEIDESDDSLPLDRLVKRILRNRELAENLVKEGNVENALGENMDAVVHTKERQSDEKANREIDNKEGATSTDKALSKESKKRKTDRTFSNSTDEQEKSKSDYKVDNIVDIHTIAKFTDNSAKMDTNTDECKSGKFIGMPNNNKQIDATISCDQVAITEGIVRAETLSAIISVTETQESNSKQPGQEKSQENIDAEMKQDASENSNQKIQVEQKEKMSKDDNIKLDSKLIDRIIDVEMTDENKLFQCNAATKDETMRTDQAANETKDEAETIDKIIYVEMKDDERKIKPDDKSITAENNSVITRKRRSHMKITPRKRIFQQPVKLEIPSPSNLKPPTQQCLQKSPQEIVQIAFPQSIEILQQQSSLVPTQHPHMEILTQEIVPNPGLSSTVSTQQSIKLPPQIVDALFQQNVDILPEPSAQFSCNQSTDAFSVGSKEIETNETAIITKLEPSECSIVVEEVPKYVKLEEKLSLTETATETEQNELASVSDELEVNLVVEGQISQSGESEKLTFELEDVKPAPTVDNQKLTAIVEVEKLAPVAETEELAPIVEEEQQAPEEKLTTPAQQPLPIVALQEEKFHSSVTLNSFQINDLQFDTPYEHVAPKTTRSRKGSIRARGRKSTSPEKLEMQAFENKQITDSSIINKSTTQYDSLQMQSPIEITENQTGEMNVLEPTIFDPANNDLVIPETPQPHKRTNRRLSKFKEQSQKPATPLSEDIQERIKIYSFDDHIDNIVELPKRGGFSAARESKTSAEMKSHLISNNTITIMPVPDVCSPDIPKPEKSRKSTNARYRSETHAIQEIPKISRSKRSKTVPQHAQYISDVCIPEYTKPDRLRRTTATTASYYENSSEICINKIPRPERSKRPQPLHSGYEKMIVCDNNKYDQNSHKKRKLTIEDDIPSFIIDKCSPTVAQDFPPPQKLVKVEPPPMPDYNSTQSKNRSKATASLSTQVIPCNENIFDISNMPILMTTDSAFMSTSLEKMQGISSVNESVASNEVAVKQSSKATQARGRKKVKQQQTTTQSQTHTLAYENLPPPPPLQMNPHQVLGGGKQIGIDGKGNKFVIIKSGNSSKMIIQPDIPKISASPPPIQHSQLSSYIPNEQPKRHATPAEKKGNVISSQTILSNITGSPLVLPKGQIIQACVGGQIVITSKGTVITTNSPSTTVTSRSYSTMQLSNAVTQASELLSNTTTCISSSSSSPADQPYQQRQNRQPVVSPSLSQNLATVEIQLAETSSSGHPSTSGIIRRDVVKMSQRKLTEMKRLGYIEQKPIGKVLTADGFQEFHNTTEHIIPVRLPVRNQKSTSDDTSSSTDIPPLAPFSDGQSTQKKSTKKKPTLNPKENIIPVTSPAQQKSAERLGKNFVGISIPHTQLELIKNGNLLAVPGDTFGGPRYSFYICTVADNATGYLPIDGQPLYLDANNQLVPKRLLTTPPEISDRPVEIVLDHQQQMQLEQHLKQQEQQKQEQLLQEQQLQQEQLQLKLQQEQLKLQQEQQLKLQQEQLKLQQEQQLKLEQERQLKLEQERQMKLEQERQLRLQQERQLKLEQERQMKLQQERQLKLQQEQQKLLQEKHLQQQRLQQEQEQQLQLQHEQQMQQEQEQLEQQLQQEQQLQLEQQQIGIENEDGEQILTDHTFLINTGEGHQILLDYSSLVSLAASANEGGAHLVTPDGQTLVLSPDFLAAIGAGVDQSIEIGQQYLLTETLEGHMEEHNHDILAAALAGTEVYHHQEQQLIGDVLQIETSNGIQLVEQTIGFQSINHHPAPAQTNETNAIQPPIMSALEIPSNKGELIVVNKSNETGLIGQNLDDSLAVIGVTTQSSIVPSSLELPITVTNPAIAPKTVTPISLSGIYTAGSVITGNEQELAYELFTSSNSMVSQNHSHIFSSNSFKNNDNTIQIQSGSDDNCLNEIILQSVSSTSASGSVIHQQSPGDYIIGAEQTCNEFTVVQNQSDSDAIVYDDPAR